MLERKRRMFDNKQFGGNREAAIRRDGYKCVRCGMTRDEHRIKYNRDITVDHIDRRGHSVPITEKNNSMDNLQTLCLRCHGLKDGAINAAAGVRGEDVTGVKLTEEDITDIYMYKAAGFSNSDIAKIYPVVNDHIGLIGRGKTWKHVYQRVFNNQALDDVAAILTKYESEMK